MVKISVIMSVAAEKEVFLRKSIESILTQTFKCFEFLIIDDASDEEDKKVLAEYAILDKRIKVIRNIKRIGLTRSLNKALKLAKGEYIARMDSDDIAMTDRFEKQLNYMEKHRNVMLLGANSKMINRDGGFIGDEYKEELHENILMKLVKGTQFLHPSLMFRKEILDEIGGYNEKYWFSQDYDFVMRIAHKFETHNLQEFLIYRRINSRSFPITQLWTAWKIRQEAIRKYKYPKYWYLYQLYVLLSFFSPLKWNFYYKYFFKAQKTWKKK